MGNSESQQSNDNKINLELNKDEYLEYINYKNSNNPAHNKQNLNKNSLNNNPIHNKQNLNKNSLNSNPVHNKQKLNNKYYKYQTQKNNNLVYHEQIKNDSYNTKIKSETYLPRIKPHIHQPAKLSTGFRQVNNQTNNEYNSNQTNNEYNSNQINQINNQSNNEYNNNQINQINSQSNNEYNNNQINQINSQSNNEYNSNQTNSHHNQTNNEYNSNQTNNQTNNEYNNSNEIDLNKLTLNDCDPFKILKTSGKITLNQLRIRYKKLALIHHPDKGGSRDKFEILLFAYKNIGRLIEYKKNNKGHNQLKNSYKKEYENQSKTKNVKLQNNNNNNNNNNNKKKFSITKFNNIFNETVLENPYDLGYESMMEKTNKERDDIEIENTVGKFTNKNFHTKFNIKKKGNKSTGVIIYKEPQAVESNQLKYSTLGQDIIKDYSDGLNNKFTDYKKAHNENYLIDPDSIQYKKYKNVEQLKSDRKNIVVLSQNELREIENIKKEEENKEWNRRERLKKRDNKIFEQYSITNKLMLN